MTTQTGNLRIIDWNPGFSCGVEDVIATLESHTGDGEWVATLQEVKPVARDALREAFAGVADMAYSLDYRAPGPYDGIERTLGVMMLAGGGARIADSGALDRSPFPDRTLWVRVSSGNQTFTMMSMHSLTGCGYKKAKSCQFFTFAEYVDRLRPAIATFDVNEPKVDHYDIEKMVFFKNKDGGKGARTFFETLRSNGLADAYAQGFDPAEYVEGEPLAISHVIRKKTNRRYDFTIVQPSLFQIEGCEYLLDEAEEIGADHAIMITDLLPRS